MRKPPRFNLKVKFTKLWNGFRVFAFCATCSTCGLAVLWICLTIIDVSSGVREAPYTAYQVIADWAESEDDKVLLDEIGAAVEDNFISTAEWSRIYDRHEQLKGDRKALEKKELLETIKGKKNE